MLSPDGEGWDSVRGVRVEKPKNVYEIESSEMGHVTQANNKSLSKVITLRKILLSSHTLIIHEEFLYSNFTTRMDET